MTSPSGERAVGEHEPIDGKYLWIEYDDTEYRIYYEKAGDGEIPLICLHTAGGDSRQFRHQLNDSDLRDIFTVYAFDMPWHGRSYPPLETDWWDTEYRLTTEFYSGVVMEFVRTLELTQPVVMGCSMGGEIVLDLAADYGDEIHAIIGLETTEFVSTDDSGYVDTMMEFFSHPYVNQEAFRPEWTYGLQAPDSPETFKRETCWIYSQAGDGVYAGDLYFYTRDFDAREKIPSIETERCGVYLLTGEYDFSGKPSDTRRVANEIDGSYCVIIEDIGHFPPTENPEKFKPYLMDIANRLAKSE
jgi:pimeloyl-ACP methyl ester carboxylesterase